MSVAPVLLLALAATLAYGAVWSGACQECPGMPAHAAEGEGARLLPPDLTVTATEGGIAIWTNGTSFEHGAAVAVLGYCENSDIPATIIILNPAGNIAAVRQVEPAADGTFETSISTTGTYWKQDGWYTVTARAGPGSEHHSIRIGLGSAGMCDEGQIPVDAGHEGMHCIAASADVPSQTAGSQISLEAAVLDTSTKTLTVRLSGENPGRITLDVPRHLLDSRDADGTDRPFVVAAGDRMIPFEEADSNPEYRRIVVEHPPDQGYISVSGTHVIPEFGVAFAVLAVAVAGALAARRMTPRRW